MARCGNLPYDNGRIPASALTAIGGGHRLDPKAAAAFMRMREAAAYEGVTITLTDSYRSYEAQVQCRASKGSLCAEPGTSKHGCGLAIDVGGEAAQRWIQANGERFGWVWPRWARRPEDGGSKYEPWHFEFGGDGSPEGSGVSEAIREFQPSNPLIPDELEQFGYFLGELMKPETWVRIAYVVGGGVAVLIGLYLIGREMGLPSVTSAVPVGRAAKAVGGAVKGVVS